MLEDKGHRAGHIEHLGDLRFIHLYDNDRQIEVITFRWSAAGEPSYALKLWALDS